MNNQAQRMEIPISAHAQRKKAIKQSTVDSQNPIFTKQEMLVMPAHAPISS